MSGAQTSSNWVEFDTGLRVKGARVCIHWFIFALLALHIGLALLLYTGEWNVLWYETLLYGPVLIASVFIQEATRAITASKLGATIDKITLWPLGGLTIYGPTDKGPIGDLKVALAGALVHLPMAAFWAILYTILKTGDMPPLTTITIYLRHLSVNFKGVVATLSRISFLWNLIFCFLHLCIPIHPLSGIRVWAALLRMQGVVLTKTAKICSVGGMLLGFAMFILGCVKIFNRSIQGGITELLFGGFGFASSKILFDLVKSGRLTEDPVFGRDCYGDAEGSADGGDVGMTQTSSAPSNPDSTVPIERMEDTDIL